MGWRFRRLGRAGSRLVKNEPRRPWPRQGSVREVTSTLCGGAPQGSRLWSISSFQLQMASTGTARFGMRLSDVQDAPVGAAVLQLRKIGAAVVGTGWDRMFAEPTPAAPQSCSQDVEDDTEDESTGGGDKAGLLGAMEAQMKQMQAELADLRDRVRQGTNSDRKGNY